MNPSQKNCEKDRREDEPIRLGEEEKTVVSLEQFHEMLEAAAEELPEELYAQLNGGVLLLPQSKLSEHALDADLYTLGEYQYSTVMGSRIVIFYGSFKKVFGRCTQEELMGHVRDTLRHEFRHHIERLAGERDLEIEDEEELRRYYEEKAYKGPVPK